jgi:hypothetical protein
MTVISEQVAELERECLELRSKVDLMTDDPRVDYVSLWIGKGGVEIWYGIKDWEWDGEWPTISISEAISDAIVSDEKDHLQALAEAFEAHAAVIRAAIAKDEQPSRQGLASTPNIN